MNHKSTHTLLRRSLLLLLTLIPTLTFAYDFELGGIYYNIISAKDKEVEVTYKDENYSSYSGNIVIPEKVEYQDVEYTVTTIGQKAFFSGAYLYQITVEIPNTVTTIENGAFSRSRMWYIEIPNSVTYIGDEAFKSCYPLQYVTIGNSVTTIGNSAFSGTKIEQIKLPNSVITLGPRVFDSCNMLKSITIPASVKEMGHAIFDGCVELTEINVEAGNTNFKSLDGVLYNFDVTEVLQWPAAKKTDISIPSSVTKIGDYAFNNCNWFTEFTIPSTVTAIGICAFERCSMLTKVNIPNSVTIIPSGAFRFTSLTELNIPNSVKEIGMQAFYGCVFTEIEIPNTVTTLAPQVFQSCKELATAKVNSSILSDRIFQGCSNLKNVTLNNTVTSIGESAFGNCSALTEINIPNSVTEIAANAWIGCVSLNTIEVENDNKYYKSVDGVLYNKDLTKLIRWPEGKADISIPNSVETIGQNAFHSCMGLTEIIIPNSVTSIGSMAFAYCSELSELYIPSSVRSIGASAFSNATAITSITYNTYEPIRISDIFFYRVYQDAELIIPKGALAAFESTKTWNQFVNIREADLSDNRVDGIYYNITSANEVEVTFNGKYYYDPESKYSGNIVIPEKVVLKNKEYTVTSIGKGAFNWCGELTSVTLPNSITSIGDYAFTDCSALTAINIPNSVTSIGEYAFAGCSALTAINIPSTVTEIKSGALIGCLSLTAINVASGNPNYKSVEGILYDKGVTMLIQCPGAKESVSIPASVTEIGDQAFSNCKVLTSVIIPNSVTEIRWGAFEYCSALTSVSIPNSVTEIGGYSFAYCSALHSVDIPNSVTEIGSMAFLLCPSLTAIDVDSGNPNYKSVEGVLYDKGVTKLIQCPGAKESVSVPNTVNSIETYSFYECKALMEVNIPNSVTKIGYDAFYNCSALSTIDIPNSVSIIDVEAFAFCSALTSIKIPYSVTKFGWDAFWGCKELKSVTYHTSTPIEANDYLFDPDAYQTAELVIPIGTIDVFRATMPWNQFVNIREADLGGVDEVMIDNVSGEIDYSAPYEVYNLRGVKVATSTATLAPGLYIIKQGTKTAKITL